MRLELCFGRKCKLGWGYNKPFSQLIPIERDSHIVTLKVQNPWEYSVYDLSSNKILYWIYPTLYIEPSCKKVLDFQIIFDNTPYWQIQCCFSRRKEESKNPLDYPFNCSHFISEIDHGVDFWIYFPKIGFPEKMAEVKELFRTNNFNETQKKVNCKVLINYSETKEMTLETHRF